MISDRKPVRLGQYLHRNAIGVTGARRGAAAALREGKSGRKARRGPDADSQGVEVRDPLEVMLLAGDRDEYVDRSFWHDAGNRTDGLCSYDVKVTGRN